MNKVFLGLGSNLGNRIDNLANCISLISQNVGEIYSSSGIYETEPWGYTDNRTYLNQVVLVKTNLSPHECLDVINDIEVKLGRVRSKKNYEARTIDIDILFFNDLISDTTNLRIPHPAIAGRRFVLEPAAEIAPEFRHPVYLKTLAVLLNDCTDTCKVYPYKGD